MNRTGERTNFFEKKLDKKLYTKTQMNFGESHPPPPPDSLATPKFYSLYDFP